uniref:Uncharacterized protein n=1 Tax=Arundo donax TaxID=35708 RepID=A0A0A8ZT72_ARUDO
MKYIQVMGKVGSSVGRPGDMKAAGPHPKGEGSDGDLESTARC